MIVFHLLFQATHMADFSHVQSIHTTSLGDSSTTQLHLRVAGSPGMDLYSQWTFQETKHYRRYLRVLYVYMLYCVTISKSYCIFRPPLGDLPQPRHCRQHGRPHRRILPHRQQLKQLDLVKKRWETNRIRCQWIIDSNRQVHLIQGYSTKFCTFSP